MRRKLLGPAVAMAALVTLASVGQSQAQETCGGVYTVKPGDSLTGIADRLYQNAGMWTEIHASNRNSIGPNTNNIRTGQRLRIACINGLPKGLAGGTPLTETAARVPTGRPAASPDRTAATARRTGGEMVRILAGDGYPPFSDRGLAESGMLSAVVDRAFAAADMDGPHKVFWVNDRAAHLDPMLASGMADIAFPWIKPACDGAGDCADFLYSDPMFEMLVVLYAKKGAGRAFDSLADLAGHRLCRPDGLPLEALNGPRAGWLEETGVTVLYPATAHDCFERLMRGETDFVALNEFTGRMVLTDMGLRDQVDTLDARPLSIETLHVVAHRSNPRGEELISQFNRGLAAIRENGAYNATMDSHLSAFWAGY